jgi:hypothetical protein
MCIVVDADTLPSLFNCDSSMYGEIEPVLHWIEDKGGKFVYGGTTYRRQLNEIPRCHGILNEYERKGKVVIIDKKNDSCVDVIEQMLVERIIGRIFDDHHVVSIIIVSGCRLICSFDKGLSRLVRACFCEDGRRCLARDIPEMKHTKRPRVYKRKIEHEHLLCGDYIVACCK